jgi:hypothetical protein
MKFSLIQQLQKIYKQIKENKNPHPRKIKKSKPPPSYLASIPLIGKGAGVGTSTSVGGFNNGTVAFVLFFATAFSVIVLIILLDFISLTSSIVESW